MIAKLLHKIYFYLYNNRNMLIIWFVIITLVAIGLYFKIDKEIIAVLVVVLGVLGNAFIGLASLISMIPVLGPLIVKVLSLPIFWLLNSLGYFVSVLAIKKGYKSNVINFRIITIVFLIGFAIGFIIAKLI